MFQDFLTTELLGLQVCDRFMSRRRVQKLYNKVLAFGLLQYAASWVHELAIILLNTFYRSENCWFLGWNLSTLTLIIHKILWIFKISYKVRLQAFIMKYSWSKIFDTKSKITSVWLDLLYKIWALYKYFQIKI